LDFIAYHKLKSNPYHIDTGGNMAQPEAKATYTPLSRGRYRFNQGTAPGGKAVVLKRAAVRSHRNSQLHGSAPKEKQGILQIKVANNSRYCPYCDRWFPSYFNLNTGRNMCGKCNNIFIVP
jgi:hypothetical protein